MKIGDVVELGEHKGAVTAIDQVNATAIDEAYSMITLQLKSGELVRVAHHPQIRTKEAHEADEKAVKTAPHDKALRPADDKAAHSA